MKTAHFMPTMPRGFVRDGLSSTTSPFASECGGVSFVSSAISPKALAMLRARWRRSSRSRWRALLHTRAHLPADARWHGPPTRATRPSAKVANTTFQIPVLRRRSVLCDLDGFEPSCAWQDDGVTSQVAKLSFHRISRYRKRSTVWSLTMPVACMWVAYKTVEPTNENPHTLRSLLNASDTGVVAGMSRTFFHQFCFGRPPINCQT